MTTGLSKHSMWGGPVRVGDGFSTIVPPKARERTAGWISHDEKQDVRLSANVRRKQGQDRSSLRGASDEARRYVEQ